VKSVTSKCLCREGWVTKECDSRYWIGGEGIPSRDHTGQGEEKAEAVADGF